MFRPFAIRDDYLSAPETVLSYPKRLDGTYVITVETVRYSQFRD